MEERHSKYISYNGKIILKDHIRVDFDNRSFQYGDGLFETMHSLGNSVQFFYEHMERLINGMKALKMEVPVRFSIDTLGLQNEISKLLTKNRVFKGGRVRLTVFRENGGFYSPQSNEINYVIQTENLAQDKYIFNEEGYSIDVFEDIKKPVNILSGLKMTSSVFFVMAGIFKTENNLDECLILNERGNVVEGVSSNVFLVKENSIYTPPLKSGCLNGIMRGRIIKIAKAAGYTVYDGVPIQLADVMAADELFFTNAISGVKWALGYKQRRYYNKIAKQLNLILNESVFSVNEIKKAEQENL